MAIKKLTVLDVKELAHFSASHLLAFNQPIPKFESVDLGRLQSCLDQPFASAFGKDVYRGIIGKSSILFYLLNKNHCFPNGNKRVAIMVLFAFLMVNNYWLSLNPEDLLDFAVWVAARKPKEKDLAIGAIEKKIKDHLIEI